MRPFMCSISGFRHSIWTFDMRKGIPVPRPIFYIFIAFHCLSEFIWGEIWGGVGGIPSHKPFAAFAATTWTKLVHKGIPNA